MTRIARKQAPWVCDSLTFSQSQSSLFFSFGTDPLVLRWKRSLSGWESSLLGWESSLPGWESSSPGWESSFVNVMSYSIHSWFQMPCSSLMFDNLLADPHARLARALKWIVSGWVQGRGDREESEKGRRRKAVMKMGVSPCRYMLEPQGRGKVLTLIL